MNHLYEFGPYLLERELGVGGMGVVYQAVDRRVPRTVAVKILHPALAVDPVYRERFRRESAMLTTAEHPHIVPVYNSGEFEHRLYLDMRFIDGDDLQVALERRGAMPADRAVALIEALADAVDFVHQRGVLHRDIKPKNVMLAGARFFPYLLDFGIARSDDEASLTQDGAVAGSLDYLAPERYEGRPATRGSDVYALTGVLLAGLTGQPPYPGRSGFLAMAKAHCDEPVPRPSAVDPVLAPFDPVIARGMAKDPAARFGTADELADAARAALRSVSAAQDRLVTAWRPATVERPVPAERLPEAPPAPVPTPATPPPPVAATELSGSGSTNPAWPSWPAGQSRPAGTVVWAAWGVPVAALLAVIGVFIPWFHAEIERNGSTVERAPHALSAWGDGVFGVLIPISLVLVSLYVVQVARGRWRSRAADPARRSARAVFVTGAGCCLLALIAFLVVPDNYTFVNGASWDAVEQSANASGASLSRGTQAGFVLTLIAALLATATGAVLLALSRRPRTTTPVGPAQSWIHQPPASGTGMYAPPTTYAQPAPAVVEPPRGALPGDS